MIFPNTVKVKTIKLFLYENEIYTEDEYMRLCAKIMLEAQMDKKIKKIEKGVKKSAKELKELEKMDKKRDPACEAGEKMMKKKK
jgi:hypothetical protein